MLRSAAWVFVLAVLSAPAAGQTAADCGHGDVRLTGAENRRYGADFALFSQYRVRRQPRDQFAIEIRTSLARDSLLSLFLARSDSAPQVGRTYPIGSAETSRTFEGSFVRSPKAAWGHAPLQFVDYGASNGEVVIDSVTQNGSLAGHGRFIAATGPRRSARPEVDVRFDFVAVPESRQCHGAMVRAGLVQSPRTTP